MLPVNHLFLAIQQGDFKTVQRFLLEKGVDVVDNFHRTALMNAALYNQTTLILWLIEQHANLDLQDKNGYTALHFSAQEAAIDCTKLLLKHGANPNLGDHHQNTPAWVAIMNWKAGANRATLEELIAYKANLKLKNKSNRTAFDLIPSTIRAALGL
ncbi:MAG: ankyrin repeat domain-containing protein [Aureispira sp.]